jgi:GNAT superfamily N-acetyltransferase
VIRPALGQDEAAVTALIHSAYQGYVAALGRNPQPMEDDYATRIAAGEVSLLEQNGVVIGVLVCTLREGEWLLRTVGIAPAHQGRGHGRQLVDAAECLARQAGHHRVHLYTNEVMTGNVALYQHLGYRETQRNGPAGKQIVYMVKDI